MKSKTLECEKLELLNPGNSCMMNSTQSQITLEAELESLQCHFTWDLDSDSSKSELLRLRDILKDIGTKVGYSWLGHIYNLQGYIHYMLSFTADARRYFSRATEAFRQMRNTVSDEGPWLVVNYGNLAWLHHLLGEQAESQTYVSKVVALLKDYPSPAQDELHPEIYAEKAWTLMKFSRDKKLLAEDYFRRAIRMQPDMVEWHSSHVFCLALVDAAGGKHRKEPLEENILEKMKIAKKHDPENLYLAALYLEENAKKGKKIGDEARKLAKRVLQKPVSSYSGIVPLLRLYTHYVSKDEAIDLIEGALERHPEERFLKRCAANSYKHKIFSQKDTHLQKSMIDRAIGLFKEVIKLYPDSSLKEKISLADIHAKSIHSQAEADQIYKDLLESDLEPAEKQMLYHCYAKHLNFTRNEDDKSIEYHMMAAALSHQSVYREKSIRILERIRQRNRNRMCGEIEEFLSNLPD